MINCHKIINKEQKGHKKEKFTCHAFKHDMDRERETDNMTINPSYTLTRHFIIIYLLVSSGLDPLLSSELP